MNPLNGYGWAFSLLVSVHLVGIVCGVGTAALVDLRLLGVGLTKSTPAQLWKGAMPWTLGGLFVAITAGLLLFSIDPIEYWANSAFRFKMWCLALALVFYYTLVRKAAVSDARGAKAVIVASFRWDHGRSCHSAEFSLDRWDHHTRCFCCSISWR